MAPAAAHFRARSLELLAKRQWCRASAKFNPKQARPAGPFDPSRVSFGLADTLSPFHLGAPSASTWAGACVHRVQATSQAPGGRGRGLASGAPPASPAAHKRALISFANLALASGAPAVAPPRPGRMAGRPPAVARSRARLAARPAPYRAPLPAGRAPRWAAAGAKSAPLFWEGAARVSVAPEPADTLYESRAAQMRQRASVTTIPRRLPLELIGPHDRAPDATLMGV